MSLISRRRVWQYFDCLYRNQLTDESTKADQPEWIQTPLLNHQKTALHAALQFETAKQGIEAPPIPGEDYGGTFFSQYGILGDRVGSGKSLIALAMIKQPSPSSQYSEYINRPGPADGMLGLLRTKDQRFTSEPGTEVRSVQTALFLIPHALIGQWEEYVKNDTSLNAVFIKKRKDAQEEGLFERLDTIDALFVSATMWKEFEGNQPISTVLWSRVFVDEADTISVVVNHTGLHSRFYWLISASWMNLIFPGGNYLNLDNSVPPPHDTPASVVDHIQNHKIGEYMNVQGLRNSTFVRRFVGNIGIATYNISILNATLFQATRILIHNSEAYIRRSFAIPDVLHHNILCTTPPNVQILRDMISSEMMERLHAGDPDGVLEMLGMQSKSASEIIEAVTETIQKEVDQLQHLYEFKRTLEYSSEAAKAKSLEQLETKIARLKSRIDAIESRLKNTQEETCPICYCEVSTPSLTPCCRNLFCFACICQVLKYSSVCPMCRESIHGIQTIQVLGDSAEHKVEDEPDRSKQPKTKQETFRQFLRENPEARVLMFSGYDATFQGLSNVLETDGIPHATLNGSQNRISKLIRDFGAGKYRVLFLNARNMGAGLNIQPATHVVLYHRMSVELQNQIVGRAMRMGRTEPLTVLHFLHGDEMTALQMQQQEETIEHV